MTAPAWCLVISEILFLAMFLAAEPLEILADRGQILAHASAYLFASRWRHGMAGNWPIYMPGFFAVALSVWFWALGRRVRDMIVEGCALTIIALLLALLLQPWGTAVILKQFQAESGFVVTGPAPANTFLGVFRSVYTLATFVAGIISIQIAIARLQLWPLILPVVMNVVLSLIRPWTVTDFTTYWINQVGHLNSVATFSLIAAVVSAFAMVSGQRRQQ